MLDSCPSVLPPQLLLTCPATLGEGVPPGWLILGPAFPQVGKVEGRRLFFAGSRVLLVRGLGSPSSGTMGRPGKEFTVDPSPGERGCGLAAAAAASGLFWVPGEGKGGKGPFGHYQGPETTWYLKVSFGIRLETHGFSCLTTPFYSKHLEDCLRVPLYHLLRTAGPSATFSVPSSPGWWPWRVLSAVI